MSRIRQRIGLRGYVEILRAIVDGPATVIQIREKLDLGRTNPRIIVGALHYYRIVRIAAWEWPGPHCALVPAFGYGSEPDAPMPVRADGQPGRTLWKPLDPCRLRSELIGFVNLLRQLEVPIQRTELQAATGMTRLTIQRVLRRMHTLRLVYIPFWDPRAIGGPPVPNFQFGIDMRSANRPVPQTKNAANRKYRDAQKQLAHQRAITNALAANASTFQREEQAA